MNKNRVLGSASVAALGLALAACGGGGGSVNSTPPPTSTPSPTPPPPTPTPPPPTPTPPPPTGVNDDLLGTLESETFATIATVGEVVVPTDGSNTSVSGEATDVTLIYNADNDTYTVMGSQVDTTFGASDLDAAQSNDELEVFVKTVGNVTETLALTRPGTGDGQTQFVGAGFLQTQIDGTTNVTGQFDAFVYGARNTNLPSTGAGSYEVTLRGAIADNATISNLTGSGDFVYDFASGTWIIRGVYSTIPVDGGFGNTNREWEGLGVINGTSFEGRIDLRDFIGGGPIEGGFFGPNLEEVGGSFFLNERAVAGGVSGAGTITGGEGTIPVNTGDNPRFQIFDPVAVTLDIDLDAAGNVVAAQTIQSPLVGLIFEEFQVERVVRTDGRDGRFGSGRENFLGTRGEVFILDGADSAFDAFAFGFPTASELVPTTGTAFYRVGLQGAVADPGNPLYTLFGSGSVTADFASGDITYSGDYAIVDFPVAQLNGGTPSQTPEDQGTWEGAARLSSNRSEFAGDISFDGDVDYTGPGGVSGLFLGDDAGSVAAAFEASDGDGAALVGTFGGDLDEDVTTSFSTLADLTGPEAFRVAHQVSIYQVRDGENLFPLNTNPGDELTINALSASLTFDPTATGDEVLLAFNRPLQGSTSLVQLDVRASDLDAGASTAEFNAYTVQQNTNPNQVEPSFEVRDYIFDGQGGRIELSYAGFATIFSTFEGNVSSSFVPYGIVTLAETRPRTGTASYSGVVVGRGGDLSTFNPTYYDLSGTVDFEANFADDTFLASLILLGTDVDNGTSLDFGTYDFAGSILGGNSDDPFGQRELTFRGATDAADYTGETEGYFFGNTAQEVGGVFAIDIDGANGINGFANGGFVGAQD